MLKIKIQKKNIKDWHYLELCGFDEKTIYEATRINSSSFNIIFKNTSFYFSENEVIIMGEMLE